MAHSHIHAAGSGGRELFKVFDRDGSGHIRPDNFHEICQSLGIHMSATEAGAVYGR
jgi:Ca2+-binding EF-hand superfamily protein